MNKAFRDICQVGNFSVEGVKPSDIQQISKYDGKLFGIANGKRYLLNPLDEKAEIVVRTFSDFPDDSNESIYEYQEVNGCLVLLLYVFANVRRIDLESETMHFYMDRLLKSELESNNTIIDGDEVKFMQNEFIINKSILVLEYPGKQAIKTFRMYGNTYFANVERERPGVYRVKKISIYKVNNHVEQMIQFYGNIKFVDFDTALKTKGNDIPPTIIKTNEIFKTWEEFLGFEGKIFEEAVRDKGFIKYSSYTFDGDELVVRFEKNVATERLFEDRIQALNQEYDIVFSDVDAEIKSVDDLIKIRDSSRSVIRLGKTLNESFETDELRFSVPYINFEIPDKGYLLLSDRNIKVERRRRDTVMRVINAKTNATSNMLMRLSAGEEDSQTGTDIEPLTSEVKRKMFGREYVEVKENFRKAMYIALNTPDVALIQGPPGTGKTTLINGIIARLGEMGNKNYKILVSSEQHEALYNVVNKLSGRSIPPFVTSQKYSLEAKEENEAKMQENVEGFQAKFLDLCGKILEEKPAGFGYSDGLTKLVFDIQSIIDSHYSKETITQKLKDVIQSATKIGLWTEIQEYIEKIESKLNFYGGQVEDEREGMDLIKRKIEAQRLDRQAFADDGLYQFNDLQRIIKRFGYTYLLADADLKNRLENWEKGAFEEYLEYVAKVKADVAPEVDEFEVAITSYDELFKGLLNQVRKSAKNRRGDFYDIIEALKYKMSDIDNVKEIIKKYTNVVGSTCAQADRSMDVVQLSSNKYDYVIIDEAARANPLDLMLPVLLGIKVIMVGDQMQLPHYVETDYVRRFKNEKDKYQGFDESLLTKSLFQTMYDSLEKSWKEGKLKFQRHIRIQEQHRMHPVIGEFISKEFYEKQEATAEGATVVCGRIENGARTINNVNDFGVYNGKNVAWVNVPVTEGMEIKQSNAIYRIAEVDAVFKILTDVVRKNQGRDVKIGIMSFYKGQVSLINERLKEKFPEETLKNIECNTVDSYQGKEFDIVILSTTRSNVEVDVNKALGFIHYSKSRINVALSRARKLLIVVGDNETMVRNEHFNNFIQYVKRNGYYGG